MIGKDLIESKPLTDSASTLKPTGFFTSKCFSNWTVKYFSSSVANSLPIQDFLPCEKGKKVPVSMRFGLVDDLSMKRFGSNFLGSDGKERVRMS